MKPGRMCVASALFRATASIVATLLCFFWAVPASAGRDESTDLAAIYAHVAVSTGGATGPFTTVYFISNATSTAIVVTVKCFNESFTRVGPAAGTAVNLVAFDVDFLTPVTLGLTTDPAFTGLGWCYFATTSGGEDFAVTLVMGIQGNNPFIFTVHPLFASNASLAIGGSTAQADVTDDDANVPLWLGSNWTTFLFILDPTAASFGTMNVDVYGIAGNLLGSSAALVSARDLELFVLSSFGGSQGNADVSRSTGSARGYMGWVYAINNNSFEAFLHGLPLDKDDVSLLVAGDRP